MILWIIKHINRNNQLLYPKKIEMLFFGLGFGNFTLSDRLSTTFAQSF